jgi:metallo-beta-lactamase family protein
MTSLSFHGAAGSVTGSRFLLETEGRRLLVDCGMFQGLKELRARNWDPPPFDPARVEAVVLTHAHIDHCGWLPRLHKLGFRGPIWCTPATAELADLLLRDSAHIQEEDAEYANRKGYSRHRPALPLYTVADAERAIALLRVVDYRQPFDPLPRVRARFQPAGHLIGSAYAELQVADRDPPLRLLFSGDVGRYDAPLVPDPTPPTPCDVLVLESTYGDRNHPVVPPAAALAEILRRTIARHGTVLIPAFAVGRAQQMIFLVQGLMDRGEVPRVPIHLDSPMAVDATQIYRRHAEEAGLEGIDMEKVGRGTCDGDVCLHVTRDDSMKLNDLPGPRVILASSGMLTGGRVLHHLRRLLPDPKNALVLVGFQAEGTRGRALKEGARYLRIHGGDVPVRAEVVEVPGLSAHADAEQLLRWLRDLKPAPERTFLVHGEPPAARALKRRLEGELGFACTVARQGDRVEL